MAMIARSGFYGGQFYKAGQSAPQLKPPGKMSKDDLLAEAAHRGIEIAASATKAEILAALETAGSQS